MKKNDLVVLKETNQMGILTEIIKEEGFPDEYVVLIGKEEYACYRQELEVANVQSK
tara:strand:- start:31 stop:198 length:168 start_codon:yes stop_codon:yes gene_type:complete